MCVSCSHTFADGPPLDSLGSIVDFQGTNFFNTGIPQRAGDSTITKGHKAYTFDSPDVFFWPGRGYIPFDSRKMYSVTDTLYVTAGPQLDELSSPDELKLPRPVGATAFRYSGDRILFFVPYQLSFGNHYERIVMYRLTDPRRSGGGPGGPNPKVQYVEEARFNLKDNYINSAVATKSYLLISYWPYNVDEIRVCVCACMCV
jgi:hypothetical protein